MQLGYILRWAIYDLSDNGPTSEIFIKKCFQEHNKLAVGMIKNFMNKPRINNRKNCIKDILRGLLGVFLGLMSGCTAFASKRFRHYFFSTDTRAIFERCVDTLNDHDKMHLPRPIVNK